MSPQPGPAPGLRAYRPTDEHIGWAGVALALIAAFIALPPALVRASWPSIVIAAVGIAACASVVRTQRRLGLVGVVLGAVAIVGAIASVRSGEGNLRDVFAWSALVAAMLRYATPLLFAALGGIISERSGVINLGLEGMMLTGCLFGVLGSEVTGSWVGGVGVAMLAGGVLALVHAFFSLHLRADQVVSGTAINFLALGITGYIYIDRYGEEGTPDTISRVPNISIPGVKDLGFFGEAIGSASVLTWVALILVIVVSVGLFRTGRGLRLRAVGEKPRAAETVGIGVLRTRYAAVVISGMLSACGGAYLAVGFVGSFNENMTAGRGFIALAAVIFGKWRPGGALMATLLFGFSSGLADRLPTFSESTAVLFQALPYVLTLIAVAGLIGRSRAPAGLGIPYVRE